MRLTQIKLAGFKSFVDPTVIPTPSQLVGVVGPNGCGKSNIIDAVRWVMGESRASELPTLDDRITGLEKGPSLVGFAPAAIAARTKRVKAIALDDHVHLC